MNLSLVHISHTERLEILPSGRKISKGGDFSLVRFGFSARCSDTRVSVLIFRYLLALKEIFSHVEFARILLDVF